MSYKSLTIRDEKQWNGYVSRSLVHELFHTWYYHALNKEGEPLLFVYEEADLFIALPLIKRPVQDTGYYDMTSVYGYSGPISNVNIADVDNSTAVLFKEAFLNFMDGENAVCIFSRLHPFLNQHFILDVIGGVKDNGTTLLMDLTISLDEQRSRYEKRLCRQIRKLREKDYLIKEVTTFDEIKSFTAMYKENMDRVNASSKYYFDEQYFVDLLNAKGFDNKLVLIYDGAELISGALILISADIIRNHLSATAANYLKASPSKLLTDEISMIGRRLGKKLFHLGGGVGGREDSLFEFKRYFSNLQARDRIWCYINNRSAYDEIVTRCGTEIDAQSTYFPVYRQPKRQAHTCTADTL